jgi:hypothetical protein
MFGSPSATQSSPTEVAGAQLDFLGFRARPAGRSTPRPATPCRPRSLPARPAIPRQGPDTGIDPDVDIYPAPPSPEDVEHP